MRALLIAALFLGAPAVAQDRAQTLADIRQELTVLYVEMQRLKRELSTTGGAGRRLSLRCQPDPARLHPTLRPVPARRLRPCKPLRRSTPRS